MGRNLIIAGVLLTLTFAVRGGDGSTRSSDAAAINKEFSQWIFPGSKLLRETTVLTENGQVTGIAPAAGQYSTDSPFHEVVRFYVDRSGYEPPNWSILGRKFPDNQDTIPWFGTAQMGKSKTVTIQHHIRPDSAVMTLLMTDLSGRRTTVVTISRGLQNAQTFIQIARHVQN